MPEKQLRELKDEVILPADKGNATVVMRREDFNKKMRKLLDTTTYRQLKGAPKAMQENRLSHTLQELEKCKITGVLYNRLRPSSNQPPGIYGHPKKTSLKSYSDPLSNAKDPRLISRQRLLLLLYLP